jgi:type I restriction enzyme S subunit
MKKYNTYKDSGVQWIGEIPKKWEIKRLKLLGDIIPSNVDKKTKEGERKVELCNYVDVYKNDFITDDIKFMKASASDVQIEKLTLRKFDVIATKDSEDPKDIGVPALVKSDFDNVVCGYHLTLVRCNENVLNGNYFYWVIRSEGSSQYFYTVARGITRYAIGSNVFKNINVPLPESLEEQTQIANYLNHKTAQLDTLIAKKEQLINLLQEERTAMINQAVTKGLDPNVRMKDSGMEWLGEIPEHWERKKLKHIFDSRNSIRVPLSSEERGKMESKTYDYYGASGVIDKVEDYLFDEELILIGEDGANLLTRSKRLAFIANGKYWVNNHAHIIKPKKGNIYYLCELLEMLDYSIWVTGSAQPKLTQEALMSIQLFEPSVSEQNEIYEFINLESQRMNSLISKTQQEINLLKEYKTALISEVVTGKVDVREDVLN